jgi:ABC-type uncharacterized transport system fused permease/ATPase subunit
MWFVAFQAVHLAEARDYDADQRITIDVEKLCRDLAGLVTGMVKPLVDIVWYVASTYTCF